MSFRLVAWAKNQRVGDPVAKAILLLLAEAANSAGFCWLSHRTLSEDSEVPRRTLQRKIEHLVGLGLVVVEERRRENGGQTSNGYSLKASREYLRDAADDEADPRATVAQGGASPDGAGPRANSGAAYEPSSSNPETSDEVSPRRREIEEGFERFWSVYPRKVERSAALKVLERLVRTRRATIDAVVSAAQRYAIAVHGRDPSMVKQPANWLHAEPWRDETGSPGVEAEPQQGLARNDFAGPPELRAAAVEARGDAWARSWLDRCGWDAAARQLIASGPTAAARLNQELRRELRAFGVTVAEPQRS